MKKKILTIAGLLVCLSVSIAGSMAYFTAEEKVHNVITTGEIGIELVEWGNEERTEPFPEDGVDGVMPGTKVTKIVEVKNTGSNAAWVRVKVDKAIDLSGTEDDAKADLNLITIDFNTEYWIDGKDGYYYYKKALDKNAVTEPLFRTVTFAGEMDNLYQNAEASVDVQAYAVQTANNPIPEGKDVTAVAGWSEL